MKIKAFISLLLPLLGLLSCAEDHPAPQVLKISEHNIHFSGKAGAWMLTVNSNTNWRVENGTDWCSVNKTSGNNTEQLIVSVEDNQTGKSRNAELHLVSEREDISLSVTQDTLRGEHHYRLPVVFHLIYDQDHTGDDTVQNIKSETIYRLIENCNALYGNNINSIDMNLELVPATENPQGEAMPEAGIDRVLRSTTAYYNAEQFLASANTANADLMWDPNRYVNVYVFTFTREDLLGISQVALTSPQNGLIGLPPNSQFYTKLPNFPWGIALNNQYIYEATAYTTLAHELGHYLGLFHVFHEKDCNDDDGDDYCDDTPSYNRQEYLNALPEMGFPEVLRRTSCDGVSFISRNIMDYDYSRMDQFTTDQYLRVRHVLENSPLIPGPKNISVTKSLTKEVENVIIIME